MEDTSEDCRATSPYLLRRPRTLEEACAELRRDEKTASVDYVSHKDQTADDDLNRRD